MDVLTQKTSSVNTMPGHHTDQAPLRDIGRGTCGSVFVCPGSPWAIKKGANAAGISNDFELTGLAYNSYLRALDIFADSNLLSSRRIPRVPEPVFYEGPSSEWWTENLCRFPDADRTQGAAFRLTYISPVLEPTRRALVHTFFRKSDTTRRDVLGKPENRDCLIRLYLGKNSPNGRAYDSTDTLRNFPMYLDHAQLIMSNLVLIGYATEMAIGLAILHWQAQIDAQDTEFVIGSSGKPMFGDLRAVHSSFRSPIAAFEGSGGSELWMLDYDKCTRVDLEASASDIVKKYLVAVTGNDPYYPHPCLDDELWMYFRYTYLLASRIIIRSRKLEEKVGSLPDALIEQWEQWGDLDSESNDNDIFERVSNDNEEEYVDVNTVEEDSESDGEDSEFDSDDSEEGYISIEAPSDS